MANEAAVAALKAACDAAYDANIGSCSNAVWDVIKAIVDPKQEYRQANELMDWMVANWLATTLDNGFALANQGTVVVGGAKVEKGHGHVIVIYPGDKKTAGGYKYNYKGKELLLQGKTLYPRCMSTSLGSWPGAKSRGDKTVWDPWGKDSAFAAVKFFTPKT